MKTEANRKIQGKLLGASDTFLNVPDVFFKTFKKNIIDLLGQEARKFGLKNVLASPKLDCSQSSIFP